MQKTNKKIINNLFSFYIAAEKLKTVIRHSWTSDPTRTESTAEHSWMLCLIALTLFEHLKLDVDELKVLKILIVHDLAEAITGDIPAFDTKKRETKKEKEQLALKKLTESLPLPNRNEILSLVKEYDERKTTEAQIAQAIDKFEAPLQHNIFGVKKWDQNDFDLHGRYKMDYSNFDPFMKELRQELEQMSRREITKAKQLHRLPKEIQEHYKKLNKNK